MTALAEAGLTVLKEAAIAAFKSTEASWLSTTALRRALFGPADHETQRHSELVLYLVKQLEEEGRLVRDDNSWRLPD